MERIQQQENSFLLKLKNFFINLFFIVDDEKAKEIKSPTSNFVSLNKSLNKSHRNYEVLKSAINLCDQSIYVEEKRKLTTINLEKINQQIEKIDFYKNLDEEDFIKLKDLVARKFSLTRDRKNLKNQINSFNSSISNMETLEKDARSQIETIMDSENKQQIFKRDLALLEGERGELIYEKENFTRGLDFISKFSMVMSFFFVLATVSLIALYFNNQINIVNSMIVVVILISVIGILLFAFRRFLISEIDKNIKKQKRAVELINKKAVIYNYYSSFLNFEYNKYLVKNAKMLQDNLNQYSKFKHLTGRSDAIKNILEQTEKDIEIFMREKNVNTNDENAKRKPVDFGNESYELLEKLENYEKLKQEKVICEKQIAFLETKQKVLTTEIIEIFENQAVSRHFMKKLMKEYFTIFDS